MSFGYPPLHAKGFKNLKATDSNEQTELNTHGMRDALQYGLASVAKKSTEVHPLEISQAFHEENAQNIEFALLRSTQGIYAPLRLQMERYLVKQPSRMSVFPPSNLHLDVLTGKDETIEFEDVLNVPDYWEHEVNPHLLLERRADKF